MGGPSLRFFAASLVALSLAACGPVFDLSIDGARQSFNRGAHATVQLSADTATLGFGASNDPNLAVEDDETSTTLSVRVDRRQFASLSRGAPLPIALAMTPTAGRPNASIDSMTAAPGATHTSAITAMFMARRCFCASGAAVAQQYNGTITVERAGTGKVHVRIEAQMNGVIPPAISSTPIRAQVLADAVIDDPGL